MNVSSLIDELEARKNDFILVADVINLMANATNSTPSQVLDYLDTNNIDEHLTIFYMDERYNFHSYQKSLVGLGYETETTYFVLKDAMMFEPINKHGIFREHQFTNSMVNDVYGRAYDINQHKKNREDNYLTLGETLDFLNFNTDFNTSSYDLRKLRDLARKKLLTPCFYFSGYVGSFSFENTKNFYTEVITGYFTYRLLTEEVCSSEDYITIPSCETGNEIRIYRILEKQTAQYTDNDKGVFLLEKKPQGFHDTEKAELRCIEADEIRFSKREIDSYIVSLTNNNENQDDSPVQHDSELLAKLENLQAENDDLNSRLSTARNTYKQHRNEIKELTEKNKQAESEKAELIKQLKSPATEQAGDVQLNGIAKYNADKSYVISTSQALASYIWNMDTKKAIRTGDMVQQIKHVMHNVAPKLLPDDKAIREWLSGIAPDYAKKAGKTPKDAPNVISLTMKK